ncbi:hypothetical protein [Paludisphaera mucosa]|uniref:Glycine zipper domain-containing protein n=1 Tax=Paludisphaera mucosa TaxID=3030827 RepID=A0ABT6F3R3_9BACT|nr:hypothetical protein [Paludisphaera mucosa]MDG3002226.1 hypothetical protein [Paludisphaera mucosa]
MADSRNPEKSVDVPPHGDRNPDPITDAPGSHPVETGIGAAVAGVASGAAIGSVAGPVGTAVGAALGAVAGGLAGKGIGELIDPTTQDNWLRDNYSSRPYVREGDTFETHAPAYRYGATAESQFGEGRFDAIEDDLKSGWDGDMEWDAARDAVRDGYDRSAQIRKQRGAGI